MPDMDATRRCARFASIGVRTLPSSRDAKAMKATAKMLDAARGLYREPSYGSAPILDEVCYPMNEFAVSAFVEARRPGGRLSELPRGPTRAPSHY